MYVSSYRQLFGLERDIFSLMLTRIGILGLFAG